jgi:hypothetical protein
VLIALVLVKVEGWLQQESQQVNEVLGAVETSDLSLGLLVLLSVLSLLVEDLLIADLPHLLGVAVLNIEGVVALEEDVFGELFGSLALVLLLEVDESLLGSRDNLDLVWSFISSGRAEVDAQLLLRGAQGEVLDEQAEVHDGLLVLEVAHQHFLLSL